MARSGAGGVGCGEWDGLDAGELLHGLLSGERLRASCGASAVVGAAIRLGGAQSRVQVVWRVLRCTAAWALAAGGPGETVPAPADRGGPVQRLSG